MVYIITIKWEMCVQEKIELSSMSQTPSLRRSLLSYKDKVTIKNCKKVPVMAKSWHPVGQEWHLPPHATPWLQAWFIFISNISIL